jgi:hypothetical protein
MIFLRSHRKNHKKFMSYSVMKGRRASVANGMRITETIRSKGVLRASSRSWVEDTGEVELIKVPSVEDRIGDLASLC